MTRPAKADEPEAGRIHVQLWLSGRDGQRRIIVVRAVFFVVVHEQIPDIGDFFVIVCVMTVVGASQGCVHGFDCVALQPDPDMGVDVGGCRYLCVAEEFLDRDEFDALFKEQTGAGVS